MLNVEPLGVLDLALLHHYMTETSNSVSSLESRREIFRTTIVELGLLPTSHYVLHAILATAALHRAMQRPEERRNLALRASAHQHAALRAVQPVIASGTSSAGDSKAMFAFSCFTAVYSLGEATVLAALGEEAHPVDSIIASIGLMRGISTIIMPHMYMLFTSPLKPLFESDHQALLEAIQPRVEKLPQMRDFIDLIDTHESMRGEGEDTRTTCLDAFVKCQGFIILLRDADEHLEPRWVHTWPFTIDEAFFRLLKSKHPMSLVVLANFAVMMHLIDGCWWLQGWSVRLLTAIESYLGDMMAYALLWPKEMIHGTLEH